MEDKTMLDEMYTGHVTPDMYKSIVPKVQDIVHVQAKRSAYKNGDTSFAVAPYTRVHAIKDSYKLIIEFFVSVLINYKEYYEVLLKKLKNDYTVAELEDMRTYVLHNIKPDAVREANSLRESLVTENLDESIEKHDTLNPKLFTADKQLREVVRDKINDIVDEFVSELKQDEININIKDVIIVGSNVSYNYTKDSDLDVHIIADSTAEYPEKYAKAIYGAYRTIFNSKFEIEFYKIPVEIYIETEDTKLASNGIYSVLNDSWVKEPVADDIPEIDNEAIKKEYDVLEKQAKEIFDNADSYENEDAVVDMIEVIYDQRKNGIADGGEYSVGNLVFKELRNNGILDKLKDLKTELITKRLSLEERLSAKEFYNMRTELDRALGAYGKAILYDNNTFTVNLIKEADVRTVISRLNKLPFVIECTANATTKYDFSTIKPFGLQPRYYTIRGKIAEQKQSALTEAVNNLKVYHGSIDGFETMDENGRMLWFSKDKWYCAQFGELAEYKISISNPLDIGEISEPYEDIEGNFKYFYRNRVASKHVLELAEKLGVSYKVLIDIAIKNGIEYYLYGITQSKEFRDLVIAAGYDGVIATEDGIRTYGCCFNNQITKI